MWLNEEKDVCAVLSVSPVLCRLHCPDGVVNIFAFPGPIIVGMPEIAEIASTILSVTVLSPPCRGVAEWGVKPKILGVGGGLGVRGGGRAGIDWSDDDAHQASSGSRASNDARHDIDARATQDFKEASDYFTSRKVSESGSHTDNNADSRVDQLSAALNSAKQSYDQYTTNMTRSHEYAEMASRTESMSGQMSEDLSATVNTFPGLVHTARHTMGVGCKRSR